MALVAFVLHPKKNHGPPHGPTNLPIYFLTRWVLRYCRNQMVGMVRTGMIVSRTLVGHIE